MIGRSWWHLIDPSLLLKFQVPGAVWSRTSAFWHICNVCLVLARKPQHIMLSCCGAFAFMPLNLFEKIACQMWHRWVTLTPSDKYFHPPWTIPAIFVTVNWDFLHFQSWGYCSSFFSILQKLPFDSCFTMAFICLNLLPFYVQHLNTHTHHCSSSCHQNSTKLTEESLVLMDDWNLSYSFILTSAYWTRQ